MKKLLCEKIVRIIKAKRILERELEVKITNRGKEVYLEGEPEEEYVAEKVIEAIELGFSIRKALLIKKDDLRFSIMKIKNYSKSKNIELAKGRIIGTGGRTLKTLSDLTDCFFEIKENEIGIIGSPENIKISEEAIILLSKGSKHGNVYSFLERNQPKPIVDLGLKK